MTLAGCSSDYEVDNLKTLQVSSSSVSIPLEGGSNTITINSSSAWTVDTTGTVVKGNAWLEFSALQGNGDGELTITAPATTSGRNATIKLKNATETQYINILQGPQSVDDYTIAQVLGGPDGKTYRVTGTVTAIANTTYGNFYMTDASTSTPLYIYGTVDASNKYNWKSFNIEVGDEVTVQGPKTTYNGTTVELVDAQFIKVNKSLIKCDSVKNSPIAKEGGQAQAYLTCKSGNGVSVTIPDDAKDWLSIASISSTSTGAVVSFKAAANTGGKRETTVTFTTTDGTKTYSTKGTIEQDGSIIAATLAEFKAAAVGSTQYRLTGIVVKKDSKGNYYINDYTDPSGEIEIYKPSDTSAEVGDVVTAVGTRAQYKTTVELGGNPTVEKIIKARSVTLAEFNAAADGSDLLLISGTVKEIANEKYGNIYVTDGTNDVFVYGVYGYGAAKGSADRQNFLTSRGIKVGDVITVVGPKTTYKGTIEMNGGYYVSHTAK